MPNILYASRKADRNHLAWRVPDTIDNQHASFQVDVRHVVEGERGRLRQENVTKARVQRTHELNELAKAVLRGDIRIPDIEDKSNIHWIQDYVIQVGRSPIEERQGMPRRYRRNHHLAAQALGTRNKKRSTEGSALKTLGTIAKAGRNEHFGGTL